MITIITILFFLTVVASTIWFLVKWVRYADTYSEEKKATAGAKFMISGLITLVLWLLFFWLFRPWFHGLVLSLFYIGLPVTVLFFTSVILLVCFIVKSLRKSGQGWPITIFVLTSITSLILVCLSGEFYNRALYLHTIFQKVTQLPDVTKVRILPLAVAKRFAEDSFQESKEKLDHYTIVNKDDHLVWQAPRVPNGAVIYFTNKMGGAVELSTESSVKNIKKEDFTMKISEGVGLYDNIRFVLYKKNYFIHIPDSIYYIVDKAKNQRVAVVPFVEYKFAFPVRYPAFGGVFLVYEDGKIEELTPEQADKSELLKSKVFYPEWLNRKEVEAYAYHRGIWNKIFIHEDQIEIADVIEGGNPQPYLMIATKPMWFTATEPQGESFGIFKIFIKDAGSSKNVVQVLELPRDSALTGPKRVVGYVRNKVEVPDWKSFGMIESRPFIKNDKLYWQLSIVPLTMREGKDSSGIDYEKSFTGIYATVFVDSKTNEVYAFKNDENVLKFADGKWDMSVMNDFGFTPAKEKGPVKGSDDIEATIQKIEQLLNHLKDQLDKK